ncbi:SMP-30/gluconolactonase/LRE family protein [Streptomyces cacaoi]|uniref:SMP-30/gluconolactonase/LRE family protein n=1 Tax=Streptomyces cacaoi TaxID=1898 RepID=UPI00374A2377
MQKIIRQAVIAAGISLVALSSATPADAVPAPLSESRIVSHFDAARGQLPENVVIGRHGSVYVTFAAARQVARVDRNGTTQILATLPAPADGGAGTPVLGFALTTGLARTDDGSLYVLYATGTSELTGLWRLKPGQDKAERIAALPADGLPNGLAYDSGTRAFYITDSVLGTVWSVPLKGGKATAWSTAPELAVGSFLGANGLRVHQGALWVTNLDQGTVLSFPLHSGHHGGAPTIRATGLEGIDDFAFTGRGNELIATLNGPNKVVRVTSGGASSTVLNASDGLQNPSSVAVDGQNVYVTNSAYRTATDPNLLRAELDRLGR